MDGDGWRLIARAGDGGREDVDEVRVLSSRRFTCILSVTSAPAMRG